MRSVNDPSSAIIFYTLVSICFRLCQIDRQITPMCCSFGPNSGIVERNSRKDTRRKIEGDACYRLCLSLTPSLYLPPLSLFLSLYLSLSFFLSLSLSISLSFSLSLSLSLSLFLFFISLMQNH